MYYIMLILYFVICLYYLFRLIEGETTEFETKGNNLSCWQWRLATEEENKLAAAAAATTHVDAADNAAAASHTAAPNNAPPGSLAAAADDAAAAADYTAAQERALQQLHAQRRLLLYRLKKQMTNPAAAVAASVGAAAGAGTPAATAAAAAGGERQQEAMHAEGMLQRVRSLLLLQQTEERIELIEKGLVIEELKTAHGERRERRGKMYSSSGSSKRDTCKNSLLDLHK